MILGIVGLAASEINFLLFRSFAAKARPYGKCIEFRFNYEHAF